MKKRLRKKLVKKAIVIMDTKSIPLELRPDDWFNIFKETGVVLWDSSNNGECPKVQPIRNKHAIKLRNYGEN